MTLPVGPLVNKRAENSTCGGSTVAVGGCSFSLSRGPFREYSVQHCPVSRAFFFFAAEITSFLCSCAREPHSTWKFAAAPKIMAAGERGLEHVRNNDKIRVFSTQNCNCFHFPTERFFTRRAGPRATAWQEPHAVEDFLALLRHNAATKLEMELWPPVVKKRRVGKPTLDEQYKRALCDWVATLVELAETLPQAKRLGWRHQDMTLRHGQSDKHYMHTNIHVYSHIHKK